MSEFVVPDKIHQIAIEGGVLDLSLAYDIIHRWQRLGGFGLVKYWMQDQGKMTNIAIDQAGIDFLTDQAELLVIDRVTITEHEHEIYLSWMAGQLEEEFGES